MATALRLGDIAVDVVRKDIKNVHLSVHPPEGTVRIAAPRSMSMDAIRAFAISKLGWIKRNQKRLVEQEREPAREYLDRESHYVWGKRHLLRIVDTREAARVVLKHSTMELHIRPEAGPERRQDVLDAWYREQLKVVVPELIARWSARLGVSADRYFIQRMKTKWGSCNPVRATIRLNTELAKKTPRCLEYVVVHELSHLLVRQHNDRFLALLDRHLPQWRSIRDELNAGPLSHQVWVKRESD